MKDKSKYRMIADSLRYQIECGELVSGSKFHTRRMLCNLFHISPMTAFQVQKSLQEQGLISNVPGIGFFVNRPEISLMTRYNAPLKKILMIGSPQAVGETAEFGSRIVAGVREVCAEHGLLFRLELVQVLNNPAHIINTSRRLEPDEGLMIFLHDELLPEIVNLLMSPSVRAVTINRIFPDKPAVLPDMRHAVSETLLFYRKKGVKRILYAGQFSYWTRLQQESEFFEVFKDQAGDFDYETDFSGRFHLLAQRIQRMRPDAVMFSDDNAALHLCNHYMKEGDFKPLLTGLGGSPVFETGLEKISTYRLDAAEMGRRAVFLLMKLDTHFKPPVYERVRGKFMEQK